MSDCEHYAAELGEALRRIAPIIKEATLALDQKGSRALRYKLDRDFHFVVGVYNTMERASTPGFDFPKGDSMYYDRVIPHRSGGQKRPKVEPRRLGHLALVGGTDLDQREGAQ